MVRIPHEKIDEIKDSADIVSYVSRYVQLKKSGNNMFGLCPFHQEKTPSFSVSPQKQIFHCFGCGKGGNAISFLMEIEKISYIEAIRRVAFDLGISLPAEDEQTSDSQKDVYDKYYNANQIVKDCFVGQLTKGKQNHAREYLKQRKLKISTISKFSIGFAPNKWHTLITDEKVKNISAEDLSELGLVQKKENGTNFYDKFRNRLMFPFHSISGRIIGFGGRRLNDEDIPKYLNSRESKIYKKGEILYGLHQAITAIRKKNSVIIVEGYFDLLRLVDAGIENVVASSGTALTEKQGRLLKRYTSNVLIAYDSDEAGLKASIRISEILESLDFNVNIIQIPAPHDPDSFILEKGKSAFYDLLKNKKNPLDIMLIKFFKDFSTPTLDQKYSFIDDLITRLLNFQNDVKIGYYLHKLAENLEITETLLVSRYNNIKKKKRFSPNNIPDKGEDSKDSTTIIRKGEWRAEEGILSVLLNANLENVKQIFNNLSSSDFENDDLKEIYELISHNWEEHNQIDTIKIKNEISEELLKIITRLSFFEIKNINKFTKDCIFKIRTWHLNSRYSEIRRMQKQESDSEKSVMHYQKELLDIKKKLVNIELEFQSRE